MKAFIFTLVLLVVSGIGASAQNIKAKDAISHIGEDCTIEGQAYGIMKIPGNAAMVFIGDYYPNHHFAVIVENNAQGLYKSYNYSPETVPGSYTRSYGCLFMYNNKPAIKIKNWESLKLLDFKDMTPDDYDAAVNYRLQKQILDRNQKHH